VLLFRRDRNCQHVKGLPIFRGEFAAFPGAVREYELQELAFLRCGLTLEQNVRVVRQFQELDAFLDVAPVGGLVRRQVAHDGCLCCAQFRGLGVEEVVADAPVELVFVHGVDTAL
jgi:hypothetical protein